MDLSLSTLNLTNDHKDLNIKGYVWDMVRPTFSIDEQIEAVVLWICYSELVSNHRTCSNKMPHSEKSNNKRRGIHPKP